MMHKTTSRIVIEDLESSDFQGVWSKPVGCRVKSFAFNSQRKGFKRAWSMLALIAIGTIAIDVRAAQAAYSFGCTSAGGGYPPNLNCIRVTNNGPITTSVRAIHQLSKPGSICNYRAVMWADKNGFYVTTPREISGTGCTYTASAWIDFPLNIDYPSGTTVCIAFFKDNTLIPGQPCKSVGG